MAERGEEVPLTDAEKRQILQACGRDALLVGGQALALWAAYFQVPAAGHLARHITTDIDYVGSARVARRLASALDWTLTLPTPDDATTNIARVSRELPDGGTQQIDFLDGVFGLDNAAVRRRAVEIVIDGIALLVMHPLDVLESRLPNLEKLPAKRNPIGLAQARLAMQVVHAYLKSLGEAAPPYRQLFDATERLGEIAQARGIPRLCNQHGLDLLALVPSEGIDHAEFTQRRWPRLVAAVERKRRAARARERRRS